MDKIEMPFTVSCDSKSSDDNDFDTLQERNRDISLSRKNDAIEYCKANGVIPKPTFVHSVLDDNNDASSVDLSGNRKILVVGDIHGCYDELMLLLDKAVQDGNNGNPFDYIISVGDLVNKGPKSVDVVRHFRSHSNFLAIRGNHDDSALKAALCNSEHLGNKKNEWIKSLSDDDIEWLLELPYTIRIPSTFFGGLVHRDTLVVHAGLIPGVELGQQTIQTMTTIREVIAVDGGSGQPRYRYRDSKISDSTDVNAVGERYPWASVWSGSFNVIFGHDAKRGLQTYADQKNENVANALVIGIDTGCCYGKKLSGLILPEQTLVQVDALDVHCPID